MKPEQINRVIAEYCGTVNSACYEDRSGPGSSAWKGNPDYFNNLNAIHEAEKKLCQKYQNNYVRQLYSDIIIPAKTEYDLQLDEHSICWILLHATSQQRSEAFVKTIGKWVEE